VRDARDVVGAVPHEREQVAELRDLDPEALDHLGRPDHAVAHRVPQDHVVADELHQVLVGGDDHGAEALLPRGAHGGRNQVVRLDAVLLEASDVEGAHDLLAALELGDEIWRGRRAVRLVFDEDVAPERVPPRIHRDREKLGLSLTHEPLEHGHGAVHRVGGLPRRAREGGYGVIRT
jgi:hypothetical protein